MPLSSNHTLCYDHIVEELALQKTLYIFIINFKIISVIVGEIKIALNKTTIFL